MEEHSTDDLAIGHYRGVLAREYAVPDLTARLENLGELLAGPSSRTISRGRNHTVRITLSVNGAPLVLAAKCFGRRGPIQDLSDARRGSRARRTWKAANALRLAGIGTPTPVGFLERWKSHRLIESCYLSTYEEDITDFHRELVRLFRRDPVCENFMSLMQCVAEAVRAMHDAGFLHNDLGNQNILLRHKGGTEWGDVMFIDLNRGWAAPSPSIRARARDMSRIYLPSDLLRVFREMYFGDSPPPSDFTRAERFFRQLYSIHTHTRNVRHPVRWWRNRNSEPDGTTYPSEKDMWIWDERSAQAISVMRPRDRSRFYSLGRHIRIVKDTLAGLARVKQEYDSLLDSCYSAPVAMESRIGLGLDPMADAADTQFALLDELGRPPVLVRFHHHWSRAQITAAENAVKALRERGHSVSVALVQDRRAVTEPASWTAFARQVLRTVAGDVEYVEVCHAINRTKWGIWNFDEHRRLLEGVASAATEHPGIRFIGPAAIDFEYPFLMAALKNLPDGLNFQALSHHLYVDRRGAPESKQGPFDALRKFVLARAIARWAPKCADRLIVSEVNWPLKGTGVWSPVNSPYESPGPRFGDPSVAEDEYADYMTRYLVTAVCSGMVERVYWWRLVARGFGLVDDTDPIRWRKRPAFLALAHFMSLLGHAEFLHKLAPADGLHLLLFRTRDGEHVCLAYSSAGVTEVEPSFGFSGVTDAFGREQTIGVSGGRVRLSGRPLYLRSVAI